MKNEKTDSEMRLNPAVIWLTAGVLLICVSIGLQDIGHAVMTFGAFTMGLSIDLVIPKNEASQ